MTTHEAGHSHAQPPAKIKSITFTNGTSISIDRARVIVFVGPNNSGKTTALVGIHNHLHQSSPRSDVSPIIASIDLEKSATPLDFDSWIRQHSRRTYKGGIERYHHPQSGDGVELSSLTNEWPRVPLLGQAAPFLALFLGALNRIHLATGSPGRFQPGQDAPTHPAQIVAYDEKVAQRLDEAIYEAFNLHLLPDCGGNQIILRLARQKVTLTPDLFTDMGYPRPEYFEELSKYPTVADQGDGVKSFIGTMSAVLAADYPFLLVDEPEVFLHPPQARQIGGHLASYGGGQVFMATHSADVLLGVLAEASQDAAIIRLTRPRDRDPGVTVLDGPTIQSAWSDPLFRSSRALDGIWHDGVVVCEGTTDSQFYSAVFEVGHWRDGGPGVASDLMFTWAGGKDRIPVLANALTALGVPVRIVVDYDALNSATTLRSLVESVGGAWSEELEKKRKIVDTEVRNKSKVLTVGQVAEKVRHALDGADPAELFTKSHQRVLQNIVRAPTGWDLAKEHGQEFLRGQQRSVSIELLSDLASIGVFVVPAGAVESWVPEVGSKSTPWLASVFERRAHTDSQAAIHRFIADIVQSFGPVALSR